MKNGFQILDSDIHVVEPPDLYERYLEERFKPQAPTFISSPTRPYRNNWLISIPGQEQKVPQLVVRERYRRTRMEKVAPHLNDAMEDNYGPGSMLRGMDVEGVDVAVLFRTWAQGHVSLDDLEPEYAVAVCRAFNNWLADFCEAAPERLKGVALISLHSVDLAIQEARRAVSELGMLGVTLEPNPLNGRYFTDPECDPLWNEAVELDVPVCFHDTNVGHNRTHHANFLRTHPNPGVLGNTFAFPLSLMETIGSLCLGGVLERFPRLRVAFLEGNFSWVPWLLWRLDEQWEMYGAGEDVQLSKKPSEYFLAQCVVSVEAGESVAKHAFDAIGDDNVVFSTDFPHFDSAFPHAVDNFLALPDISEETKRKTLWDNCARLYGMERAPVPA